MYTLSHHMRLDTLEAQEIYKTNQGPMLSGG